MLTPYDEFPVHQAAYPFSYIPSTDYSWDDGYYFGVMCPALGIQLSTGARINPNTDMIGGYVLLNIHGIQRTLRFNRVWRRNFNVEIGPWKVEFVEPLRSIRLTLGENDSGMSYDILWEGTAPAYEEEHHFATHRGRRVTDQTRYSQPGKCSGWLQKDGNRWDVTPDTWTGTRDHSWGLYAERPPLAPPASLLPPRETSDGPQRSLRFWSVFRTEPISGFFHMHETADGEQVKMNDVFGIPFGGHLFRGWDGEPIALAGGSHDIRLRPGTTIMESAAITLTDKAGGVWTQKYEVASPPWVVQTMGYHPGSWKDGGTFFTYHGSEDLALEWDEFDFSDQPSPYSPYVVTGEGASDTFGIGDAPMGTVQGPEYLCTVTTTAPDGTTSTGAAQVEMFINGRHHRYAPNG